MAMAVTLLLIPHLLILLQIDSCLVLGLPSPPNSSFVPWNHVFQLCLSGTQAQIYQ